MPDPPSIQIALQGGGAKLSALLAAMEPVQKMHRGGVFKVSRVAGTSAGAIVAALFAADVELGKVRERLKRFDKGRWKKIFSEDKVTALWNLSRGRPLWSDDFFRDELKYFFNQQDVSTLEDTAAKFGIKLLLLATNLREARSEIYSEGELIPKILDSCALPFCFRVWGRDQSPVIVDGGVCENLPAEVLLAKKEEFGPVYGISFREDGRQSPNSALSFTYALLDTAINHSVTRAKAMLGEKNLFQIKTRIRTFDFPFAFSDESDDEYNRIKGESDSFFTNAKQPELTARVKTVSAYEWSQENRTMLSLGKIFESHHMNTRVKYLETSLEVTAGALRTPVEEDYIRHRTVFRTLNDPVYCLGFSVNADHDFSLEGTRFEVFKKDDPKPIETTYLPSIAGDEDEEVRPRKRLLVYFLPPLPADSGEYVFTLKTVIKDFMKPLREDRRDYLSITPYLTDEPINKMSIVLQVPESFDLRMFHENDLGHRMGIGDLSQFNDLKGFKAFGWMASDITPEALGNDQKFRVEIALISG